MNILPNEITTMILSELHYKDMYMAMQCNRHFHSIITNIPKYSFCKQVINNRMLAVYILRSSGYLMSQFEEINNKLSKYNVWLDMNFSIHGKDYIFSLGISNKYKISRHNKTWIMTECKNNKESRRKLRHLLALTCRRRKNVHKVYKLIINFLNKAFNAPRFKN